LRRTGGKLQRLKNYAKLKSQKVFKGYFLWIWCRFWEEMWKVNIIYMYICIWVKHH
jgi:hypothetical protein